MNDQTRQKYMVSLVKWVEKNYEEETMLEMKKRPMSPIKRLSAGCLGISKVLKLKEFIP